MPNTKISPEIFRREATRRLIDAYDLAALLGLRSKEAVRERAKAGTLPPPVYSGATVTLWDRDELPDTKEARA